MEDYITGWCIKKCCDKIESYLHQEYWGACGIDSDGELKTIDEYNDREVIHDIDTCPYCGKKIVTYKLVENV